MSRFSLRPCLGILVLVVAAACAKPDAAPPAQQKVVAAGGEVSANPAAGGMAGKLTDSISAKADRGRIRGAENAPVWLVEISDFQCPFCKQWHDQTFATLDKEYVQTGKVRLAYLNFPLSSIHPNARAAAEAAMCASVQGKFWELHDALFVTQEKWAKLAQPMAAFDSLARAAGVEPKAWQSCMSSHATNPIIEADRSRSQAAGVGSTPTFFVGDRMIQGAQPTDSFRVHLDAAIAKARGGR